MDKYLKYNSAEDWQQEIDRSEHIINSCNKMISSLKEDKNDILISKKKIKYIDSRIKIIQKFIDDEEIALRKFYKEKRKYQKEEEEESL